MKDLTTGSPIKLIISLAIPMLIGNLFQQIYSVVDTIIVGRYLGEQALAGVGATGSSLNVLLCFVFGLGTGAGLIVAQAFGQKDFEAFGNTIVSLIATITVFSIFIGIVGNLLCHYILVGISVPSDVIAYSETYMRIMFTFAFASVVYNAAAAILRSVGDTKSPLYALFISCAINISLDIIFILYFKLGVSGVAYATVVAQVFSAMYCIFVIYKNRGLLGLTSMKYKPTKVYCKKIISVGFPSAFQSCLISLGAISVQRLINSYGSAAMAGLTAAGKVDSITIQIVISVCTALSIFTGQNIGRSDFDRIKTGLRQTLALMLSCCIILAIVIPFFRYQLIGLFIDQSKSAAATEVGTMYLSIIGIAYIICGIMNTYLNVLKGAGDVNTCMVAGLTELFGRIIFSYVLSIPLGVLGICLATPISWGCGCVIPVVRYYSGKWKAKKLL